MSRIKSTVQALGLVFLSKKGKVRLAGKPLRVRFVGSLYSLLHFHLQLTPSRTMPV